MVRVIYNIVASPHGGNLYYLMELSFDKAVLKILTTEDLLLLGNTTLQNYRIEGNKIKLVSAPEVPFEYRDDLFPVSNIGILENEEDITVFSVLKALSAPNVTLCTQDGNFGLDYKISFIPKSISLYCRKYDPEEGFKYAVLSEMNDKMKYQNIVFQCPELTGILKSAYGKGLIKKDGDLYTFGINLAPQRTYNALSDMFAGTLNKQIYLSVLNMSFFYGNILGVLLREKVTRTGSPEFNFGFENVECRNIRQCRFKDKIIATPSNLDMNNPALSDKIVSITMAKLNARVFSDATLESMLAYYMDMYDEVSGILYKLKVLGGRNLELISAYGTCDTQFGTVFFA